VITIIKYLFKKIIPGYIKKKFNKNKRIGKRNYILSLNKLTSGIMFDIISNDLGIEKGDVVFIHSSIDGLNLDFTVYELLNILLDIITDEGTLLFPAYPMENSYKFLKSKKIFNIKSTPAYTGLLNEFARRHKRARRSLHPTKSVVAIGKKAREITDEHYLSPYPYDVNSPYYKIINLNAKIIGLGVSTQYMSCVHCVDDYFKDNFPVNPYHKKLFSANCIDYDGKVQIVKTYAHNMMKMDFDIPSFIKKYIPSVICNDLNIDGMQFFRADAKRLIEKMINLAEDKIIIYKKIFHKF
jgi:aminoglycoside 3-N-acetyltransferase